MRQVTTHRRVGDIEHARTELRGQPHEFAQYQFHLDRLHAKRIAREKRKEDAALGQAFPFAAAGQEPFDPLAKSAHGVFGGTGTKGTSEAEAALESLARMELDELNKYFSGKTTEQARTVGYGAPSYTLPNFIFPTVDEMLRADAASDAATFRKRSPPGFYAKATAEVAATMEDHCPVMRDGKIIGTVSLRDIYDPGASDLVKRLRRMVAKDDLRRVAEKATTHKPTHGGHPSR